MRPARKAMQRSSPSIAALATALAKAQIELANPEKSLVGTIEAQSREGGQGAARQFRYAPLSSGLEIVRKTLGQHEIATVQTTAIDQAAGWIRQSGGGASVFVGRMDRLGRAVLPRCRARPPAPHGCGSDLCPPLRLVHAGRHCWRGRSRCAGSHKSIATAIGTRAEAEP